MSEQDATFHRAPDGTVYRIYTEPDQDATSPRDADNVSTLVTWDSRYISPDDASNRGLRELMERDTDNVMRYLSRYVNLFCPDIIAAVPLTRSGPDDTLATDPTGYGYHVGVAYVTTDDWQTCMGDLDPAGDTWTHTPQQGRSPSALEAIEQDIETYNHWARGDYVGYVVERRARWERAGAWEPARVMHTWEEHRSSWGFDDEDYALTEALATLPDGTVEINANELDDILTNTA